jgi:hypothetical protein
MIQLSRNRNTNKQYALVRVIASHGATHAVIGGGQLNIAKDKTEIFIIYWVNALNRAYAIQNQIVHNDWYTQNNIPLHISTIIKLLAIQIASVQLWLEFLESEDIPEREEIQASKPTDVSSVSYQSNIKVYK